MQRSISRFDLPGFSLTDDNKRRRRRPLRTADAGDHGPNYLGNDGRPGNTAAAYDAPRSNSDSQVAVADLPDPPPSSPTTGSDGQYDQRNQPPL